MGLTKLNQVCESQTAEVLRLLDLGYPFFTTSLTGFKNANEKGANVVDIAKSEQVEEAAGPGRDMVVWGGVVNTANVYGEPYERGHVEAMLRYLMTLEERFTPVEEEEGAA